MLGVNFVLNTETTTIEKLLSEKKSYILTATKISAHDRHKSVLATALSKETNERVCAKIKIARVESIRKRKVTFPRLSYIAIMCTSVT